MPPTRARRSTQRIGLPRWVSCGDSAAPGFRGDRLIKFLFREFQIRFWLAGEEEGPIKRTPD